MSDQRVTSTCKVCVKQFTYVVKMRQTGSKTNKQYAFRRVCDACRVECARETTLRWKKKHGIHNDEGRSHKHDVRYKPANEDVLKCSHADLARELKMTCAAVRDLEKKLLVKIRNNPELREAWDTFKADGMPLAGAEFSGTSAGRVLLDYQLAVVDWWAVHDSIMERGLTTDALECLVEIETFQTKIAKSLEQL